jgi:hypothetical protein
MLAGEPYQSPIRCLTALAGVRVPFSPNRRGGTRRGKARPAAERLLNLTE